MEVLRYDDPATFRRDGGPVLFADPARNNLPLSALQVLLDSPEVYPTFHLWLAVRDGEPTGLAMQTEPYGVLLADPLDDEAVNALAEAVVLDAGALPGVIGNLPWADRFTERLTTATGRNAERILNENVWHLTTVADVPTPDGAARVATHVDRELLRRWLRGFDDEWPTPEPQRRDDDLRDVVINLRLEGKGCGYWLWEDGSPVSLAGYRDIPGVGSRIEPVYTPLEHRRHGYATRLVAELSAARLAFGATGCFLGTDAANPTSNAIYARVGYIKVCEAVEYAFAAPRSRA
jgi:GNAT superfamily N-acetyltransferase